MEIQIKMKELSMKEKRALLDTLFNQLKRHRKNEYQAFITIKSKKEILII